MLEDKDLFTVEDDEEPFAATPADLESNTDDDDDNAFTLSQTSLDGGRKRKVDM